MLRVASEQCFLQKQEHDARSVNPAVLFGFLLVRNINGDFEDIPNSLKGRECSPLKKESLLL